MPTSWFDELTLDPTTSWRRMGTRALGGRPWLIADERSGAELALRARLLREHRHDVFRPAPAPVAAEVRSLVEAAGVDVTPDGPAAEQVLVAVGRSVQEDICLLQRRNGAWHLDAAVVCFPSRWRLADKIRRPLGEVHGPTPGYGEHLAERVDRLLDRLTDRPVLRRNWFIHPDASLHQPELPPQDPVVAAAEVGTGLHLRSERQTLRRLPSGWVLFTIRVQQECLGSLLDDDVHGPRFRAYLDGAPPADLAHRGVSPAQVDELRAALGITVAPEI